MDASSSWGDWSQDPARAEEGGGPKEHARSGQLDVNHIASHDDKKKTPFRAAAGRLSQVVLVCEGGGVEMVHTTV